MQLKHEEELVLDDNDPKKAKLRYQLLKRKMNNNDGKSHHKRNVTEDLDNLGRKNLPNLDNLKVPS